MRSVPRASGGDPSEFVVMLNQAPSDLQELEKMLKLTEEQTEYAKNVDAGCGLMKYGGAIIPFVNKFPQNTKLYHLMTTKPTDDGAWGNENI
jgi:hypothetical protein